MGWERGAVPRELFSALSILFSHLHVDEPHLFPPDLASPSLPGDCREEIPWSVQSICTNQLSSPLCLSLALTVDTFSRAIPFFDVTATFHGVTSPGPIPSLNFLLLLLSSETWLQKVFLHTHLYEVVGAERRSVVDVSARRMALPASKIKATARLSGFILVVR